MLKIRQIEQGIVQAKATYKIHHPKADLITVQIGHDAACNFPVTVELALSNGYTFLTDVVPDFSSWSRHINDTDMKYYNMRGQDRDASMVIYENVPLTALAKFLHIYS